MEIPENEKYERNIGSREGRDKNTIIYLIRKAVTLFYSVFFNSFSKNIIYFLYYYNIGSKLPPKCSFYSVGVEEFISGHNHELSD